MIRLLFIFFALLLQFSLAQAVDFQRFNKKGLISTVSVLEDESGVKTLRDILAMQRSFTASKHSFSGGYTRSAYWFRIVVQRETSLIDNWILFVKPIIANNLQLYSLNKAGQYEVQQKGSLFTASYKVMGQQLGGYSFPLHLKGVSPQVFYLRLQTRDASLLQFSINSAEEICQQNINRKIALGMLFGALLMIAVNTLLMWQQVNYKYYIAFIGYILTSILNIMMLEGGFIEVWLLDYPQVNSVLNIISFCGFVIFQAVFFIYYFDTKKQYPLIYSFFLAFIGALLFTILVSPFELFTVIAPVIVILMGITSIMQLYVAWFSSCSKGSAGHYVFFGFAIYFAIFIITLLVTSGFIWLDPTSILAARITLFVVFIFIGLHKNYQNLQKQQQEAEQAKESAEKQLEEDTRVGKERSNFLSLIAHEVKTPLATIDSAIQVIHTYNDKPSKMVEERYRRIRLSVRQLNSLLDNILTAERDEKAPFYVDRQSHRLKKVIEQVVSNQLSEGRAYVIDMDDDLECVADRGLLGLLLSNLYKNAIKYSPENSTINCYAQKATRINSRGVFLVMSNSYISENKPEPRKWFNKYYKETKDANSSSLGLGLFLVKRIVNAHGGDIDCVLNQDNEVWRVTMNIWLPDIQESSK